MSCSVKRSRSKAEYCWTLTPWSIQWALSADIEASRVTYLDADTYFLKSPSEIFHEFDLSGKSFLITEHGFLLTMIKPRSLVDFAFNL